MIKKTVDIITDHYNDSEEALSELMLESNWQLNECMIILGGDFNTNLDDNIFRDAKSIKTKD